MNTAGFYLQSHMKVRDYHVVTIGLLNYEGTNLPNTSTFSSIFCQKHATS